MEDKFKLYKKWFWIGLVVGFLNGIAGLVYGIALVLEPERRKEGGLIIMWSIAMTILAVTATKYLQSRGILPPSPTL